MKRSIFDTLRRGLDNAFVNWGLSVIRLVEAVAFVGVAIAIGVAILAPILISAGIEIANVETPEQIEELLFLMLDRWVILLWIFLAVCVMLVVFVAMHAFVEAGCARVAVDADRAAGPETVGPRSRYKVFSMQRWWRGAVEGWWTLFWIYNFAWGVAGLILLIPLAPTAIIMLVARESPAVLIATGCIGIALTVLLMIVVSIVTAMWTNRAIVDWAVEKKGAALALSDAWATVKADFGRHLVITIAIMAIAMAGSSFFASFSYIAALGNLFHENAVFNFVTLPLRFFATLLNWAFSAFVTSWYLAAYAALAVEAHRRTGAQAHSGTNATPPLRL